MENGQKVWVPRTKGGWTLATVGQVKPPCESLGDTKERVYVTWTERAPISQIGGVGEVMSCYNRGGNPCVETTEKVAAKWIDSDKCRTEPPV